MNNKTMYLSCLKWLCICSILIVSACGGGSGGGNGGASSSGNSSPVVDNEAPGLSVQFPPSHSLTEAETVTVYGRSSDAGGMNNVRVNGVAADSIDGFVNWQLSVPLNLGDNVLSIEAEDQAGNRSVVELSIKRSQFGFRSAQSMAIDTSRNRLLVLDRFLGALVALGLDNANRSVLLTNSIPHSISNPFFFPRSLTLNSQTAWVADEPRDSVVAINLNNGAYGTLSNDSIPNGLNRFSRPKSLSWHASGGLWVLDNANSRITGVDTGSGARNRLEHAALSFTGPEQILTYDSSRALVSDSDRQALIAVNLATGVRSIFSDNSVPNSSTPFNFPTHLALDTNLNRILVSDRDRPAVIAVDAGNGARSIMSDKHHPNNINPLIRPGAIVYDGARSRALLVDDAKNIMAMDLASGARSYFFDGRSHQQGPYLSRPGNLVLDKARNQVLLVEPYGVRLIGVQLDTGEARVLSSATVPNGDNLFVQPKGVAVDDQAAYVIDDDGAGNQKIFAVDLQNGSRRLITENSFVSLVGVDVDSDNNRLLVLDRSSVIAVDIDSGVRTVISNGSTSVYGFDIVIDHAHNRALVLQSSPSQITAVDLDSGTRTVFADNSDPSASGAPLLNGARSMELDVNNNRLLLMTSGPEDNMIAVDLDSRARSRPFINNTSRYDANGFMSASDMALDSDTGQLLVTDWDLGAILTVNIENGERVFLLK